MKMFNKLMVAGMSAALLAGCSSGSGSPEGTLSLAVTDAPVEDATAVWVQFSGVELHSSEHGNLFFEVGSLDEENNELPYKRIDLLALEGGGHELLLDEETLPAGRYQWIRLRLDTEPFANSIVTATGEHDLTIPSGDERGLQLNRPITVPAGGFAAFTIDFDLRKSVVQDGTGDYKLRPTLRMVDNSEVGAVAGQVDVIGICETEDGMAVYVFPEHDATPVDINIDEDRGPVLVAPVRFNDDEGEYRYRAAFLTAGAYTLALTCDADQDDPQADDELTFPLQQNVDVVVGETTVANFLSEQ
ncbi:DUF4382 domain-containing protein [Desulfurivibrio sp. C05AmB]|uniref:DUF4382 domain-containing protein n=1 Tax=Desulfurivibrio sp. C05AmB TaxID=3374371 RepID=UPI00376EFE44